MTIKEAETRSGVARANIRYYEAEGLLSPRRLSNGYRSYSEADLLLLEKIKLLRRLGISVEALRTLERGGAELPAVLEGRLTELEGERAVLRRVEQVCGALREDGPSFESLEPERYLEALDAPAPPEETEVSAPRIPESDALPAVTNLGRRLAARCFDTLLLLCILLSGYALSGRNPVRLGEKLLFWRILLAVLHLLLEPLCIHLTGATPGKALLGLRITRRDGEKLTYEEAFNRHAWMLWGAVGLWIPIWSWIQIYRCCKRWSDGEPQPWDEGLAYAAQPFGRRYVLGPALACLLLLTAAETSNSFSQLPPHRGDLTAADFAENYNRQMAYLNGETQELLNAEGTFEPLPDPPGAFSITEDWQERAFRYELEDGVLRSVTLTCEAENAEYWLALPADSVAAAVTAFGWAPKDTPFFTSGRKPLIRALGEADWSRDFTLEEGGVSVAWEIEARNFDVNNGLAFAIPGAEGENALTCRCTIAMAP